MKSAPPAPFKPLSQGQTVLAFLASPCVTETPPSPLVVSVEPSTGGSILDVSC